MWKRIGWCFERGSLVLAVVLGVTLYVVAVADAELNLPPELQLALFESRHGIPWSDGQAMPHEPPLQAAILDTPIRPHLP